MLSLLAALASLSALLTPSYRLWLIPSARLTPRLSFLWFWYRLLPLADYAICCGWLGAR